MCTVSIVPSVSGFRIACNRDERRTRATADPPRIHRLGERHAIWPGDPTSGGTWIGANDAGLAMVLLNRRAPARPSAPVSSRGTIIPALLPGRSIETAVAAAGRLPWDHFEPFTLVIAQGRIVCDMTVGMRPRWRMRTLCRPLLFTSSSLGDALVAIPRRRLFARLMRSGTSPLIGQGAFHRHAWPDRREISVLMSRADAATVSRTTLDVSARAVRMRYTPISH